MASLDTDNARLAQPPRPPWPVEAVTRERLAEVAGSVASATWDLGLRRWFWGEGVCLLGLVQCGLAFEGAVPARVVDWYDTMLAHDPTETIDHVNEVAPGSAAIEVRRRAEGGRAAYGPALERLAAFTRGPSVTHDPSGAIEHWPGGVWADTMFMVGVFLVRLGVAEQSPELVEEGLAQLRAHATVLQSPNGLWVHGSHRGEAIPCHWGRANAWAALALVDAIEQVEQVGQVGVSGPTAEPSTETLRASLRRLLRALAAAQPEHGVWDVLVDGHPECRGILETSAAAGIGAAMLRGAAVLGDADLARSGWLALRGVLPYVEDGLLTRVSAGTVLQLVPFGYSVIRDDRPQPWGQGLLLAALAAAAAAIDRGEGPR